MKRSDRFTRASAILRSLRLTIDAARAAAFGGVCAAKWRPARDRYVPAGDEDHRLCSMTPNKALLIKRMIGRFRMADAYAASWKMRCDENRQRN
jgi:hypothetical protein